MNKLTKKQKKWISIGSVLGIAVLTTAIVTPIVVVNEQNAYNNNIGKYINDRNQHLIRISEIVKIYNLNGHIKTRIRFEKFLRDIKGKPLWLLSFKGYTSIIDAETYVTIQILPKTMPFNIENKNIIYGGLLGILIVNGNSYLNPFTNTKYTKQEVLNNYVSIQVSDSNSLKTEEIIKRDELQRQIFEARELELQLKGNVGSSKKPFNPNDVPHLYPSNGKFNITYQVPHAWWFYSRDNQQSSGYVDDGNKGLCEYVALSQILLYNQLFVNPMIFSENKFNYYFQEQKSHILEYSSPVFRYWLRNNPKSSLTWDLYKNANYAVNLLNSGWLETTSNKLIKQNNMSLSNWKYIQKYGGYKLAWQTVKRGIPIILGLAPRPEWDQWRDHAYLMYGYDSPTDMFLSSLCWGNNETTSVLFSYWVGCWGSYCFGL